MKKARIDGNVIAREHAGVVGPASNSKKRVATVSKHCQTDDSGATGEDLRDFIVDLCKSKSLSDHDICNLTWLITNAGGLNM